MTILPYATSCQQPSAGLLAQKLLASVLGKQRMSIGRREHKITNPSKISATFIF